MDLKEWFDFLIKAAIVVGVTAGVFTLGLGMLISFIIGVLIG